VRFYFARDFDRAICFFRQTLERNPKWNPAHILLAGCHMHMPQPRLEQALDEVATAERAFRGADPFWQVHVHMNRGKIYAWRGDTEKAEKELATLLRASSQGGNRRIAIAGVLGALGRLDEAFDWLDEAATAREAHIVSLRMTPDFDFLRSHPRFQALLKRVGLANRLTAPASTTQATHEFNRSLPVLCQALLPAMEH